MIMLTWLAGACFSASPSAPCAGSGVAPSAHAYAEDWRLVLTLSSYTLLGVAAVGIAEAQLNFVPEVRTVRERPLPKVTSGVELRVAPGVLPDFSGAALDLRGRF
jgi:hypothetical protein